MATRRSDFIAASGCALFGLLLATIPNLLACWRNGLPWSFADPDSTGAYLHFVAHAYNFHPLRLSDPALAFSGASFYSGAPFIPFILLSKIFQAGPAGVFLLWNIWSGLAMGLIIYALIRTQVHKPIIAALAAIILLADTGFIMGRPFDRQLAQTAELLAAGDAAFPGAWSNCLAHWRVINPAVTWPFLGFFLWSILRLNERRTGNREILCAISFGLLWHVYFFYWTAAALALAIAFLMQADLRRSYFRIALGGSFLGLPAIIAQASTRLRTSSDWLERGAYFVPVGRFEDLQIPKIALLWLAAIAVLLWKDRNRKLAFLAIFAGAGIALMNHQIVTRLQLQNFHWQHAWGPALSILAMAVLADRCERWKNPSRIALTAASVAVAVHLASGLSLRAWECARAAVPQKIQADLRDFLRETAALKTNLAPAQIIAGDPDYVDFAVGFQQQIALAGAAGLSPTVNNEEWRERRVLNAALAGVPRVKTFDVIYAYYGCWNQLLRMTPQENIAEHTRVEELRARMDADLKPWLGKFHVRYAATPSAHSLAPELWRPLHHGDRWTLWELAQ